MSARTGNTYTTPEGVVTRSKSGKAKSYTGKGPAPAGTKKVAEKSYSEVPTVTVASDGSVSTSGYGRQSAARRAVAAQQRRAKKVRRIVRLATAPPKTRAPKVKLPKRVATETPKAASTVAHGLSAGITKGADMVSHAVEGAVKLPDKKVTHAFGKPTLGTPTVREVVRAQKQGRLSGVRKGKVVATPRARKAKKQLKQAQKAYARKAKPRISGLLNEEQERFAETLSKETHLPPKLAGDWTLKESGASSAGAGGEAGEQNQLGVGYPAHPTSFSQSGYFNHTTPEKAAKATARWMEGKLGGEYGYQAAPSIQQIPKLAKSGASDAQLRAYIAGPSAWGTGEIPNSPQVTASRGKAGPKVTARLKQAKNQAKKLGIATAPEHADPLKVFGKEVGRELRLVKTGKYSQGKGSIKLQPGVEIAQGHEPEIAARLKLLSAKLGLPVYVISGHRTPQHSVEVGGFADDPHTEGKAADIGVGSPTLASAAAISEADYESVGLYRPYGTARGGSSAEDNHVELLNGGTPVTGGGVSGGGGGGAPSAGGAVTPSAIATYASATGQSPKAVRQKLKARKLTVAQIERKLQRLSMPGSPGSGEVPPQAPSTKVLDKLERKYGAAA